MKKVNEFITRISAAVGAFVYLWGGQWKLTSEERIKKYETSPTNVNRVLKLYRKLVAEGKTDIREVDCSGLGTQPLVEMGLIPRDTTANGLMSKCAMIEKSQLKKGCMVFRVYKSGSKKGRAYHVGYVIDDALNIEHARGRDYGVVVESLNQNGSGYWHVFGIPSFFADEINAYAFENTEKQPVFTRLLKYKKVRGKYACVGEDVKTLQRLLLDNGISPGSIDGIYGKYTEKAVKEYQRLRKITVDGIVGPETTRALGGVWQG